ncbi:MAG: NAD(P)H-hydrate epimerase [Planctomycetota bacterium]|jgi:NAD(P)H-hydrate epimerase
MTRIEWTAEEAQAMDRWLVDECGRTIPELMAVAGLRVAEAARAMIEAAGLSRVVALVGPGNNGGDALVAIGHLADLEPVVWRPLKGDPIPTLDAHTLVIDGLFGVGLVRPISGAAREAVRAVADSPATVLSVDIPSGLSATSGEVVGRSPDDPDGGVAIRAQRTVSFVGPKRGFFHGEGPAHVGEWSAVDIGFPVHEAEAWVMARRGARRLD